MAQASEVEEEEVEDAETSNGKKITAFENMPASTPGQHGTPIHSLEARQTERAIPRNQASSGRKKLQLQPPSLVWKKNNARENDDPNRNCHTRKTTQRSSTRPLNAVRNAYRSRGDVCLHQRAGCRFSHDQTVIPFGYYPRNEMAALSELTRAEMERAYGEGSTPSSNSD